jgi:phosphoribosylformimino-5-aminoimidazole carboxamide ribotide isomerase
MLIYPAIDLFEGQAVRLFKGDAASREVVGEPLQLVQKFAAAPLIHVVDLDGAFAGKARQTELIRQLAAKHPIQVGGGLRTEDDAARLFDVGVARVVYGTAAAKDPALLDRALARWGAEKIVVAMDVHEGKVAISGWTEHAALEPDALARRIAGQGAQWILCTAVHRDGTLEGPDLPLLTRLQSLDARLKVIASGGISSLDDVRSCRDLAAVVVGKAIYAGRFTLEEALAC